MANRLRAIRELTYPDAKSLPIVLEAGGVSKLTAVVDADGVQHLTNDIGEVVVLKTVKPGDWCDDLPAVSRSNRLERGDVEEVDTSPPKAESTTWGPG